MKFKPRKFIKRYILSDWPVKLICILAALVLWVYVASGQSTTGKFPSKISIKAENIQTGLIPIYDEKEVEIQISAEPAVWNKLSADSFRATVDLTGLSEGTYNLPISVISTVEGVQIVKKTPDKIMVSLEPSINKTINVNRKIQGSPAEGMVVGDVTYDPESVVVSGPKSIVEGISEGVVVIGLSGEANNFEKTIKVQAFDDQGNEITNVVFNPMDIKVSVSMVRAGNNKTVGIRPKIIGNPQDGFYISKVSVLPNTVDVTGSESALLALSFLETSLIDVSGLNGSTDKTASIVIPDGIALDPGQVASVKVNIVASENIITRQMPVTIIPLNLNNLNFSFTPQAINAVVSGPQSEINNLGAGDVSLSIDFSGKPSGTYSYDINASDIKVPQGVTVNSVSPSSISVVLANK
ncbi:MAG: CdaR family protein [Patescibacteria group bacterium]|jgi:YbbR domain-containing protein